MQAGAARVNDGIAGTAPRRGRRLAHGIRSRLMWVAAVLVLTTLGAALAESLLLHVTDDGCVVEIHCVACRWATAAVGMPTALAAPKPALPLAGLIAPRSTPVDPGGASDAAFSRGPPPA